MLMENLNQIHVAGYNMYEHNRMVSNVLFNKMASALLLCSCHLWPEYISHSSLACHRMILKTFLFYPPKKNVI